MNINKAQSGVISEYETMADLVRQGFVPCQPIMPTSPFDIVAVKDDVTYKIQVKSGVFEGNRITVLFRKQYGEASERRYTKEEVDYVAVYDKGSGRVAYVPFPETMRVSLYKETPHNVNKTNPTAVIRLFSDYESIA